MIENKAEHLYDVLKALNFFITTTNEIQKNSYRFTLHFYLLEFHILNSNKDFSFIYLNNFLFNVY